jgi:hypothetical protein
LGTSFVLFGYDPVDFVVDHLVSLLDGFSH